jgi:hypothetical protein
VKKQRFEFGHGASLVAGNRVKSPISLISKDLKVRSCHGCSHLRVFPFCGLIVVDVRKGLYLWKNRVFSPTPRQLDIAEEIKYKKMFYT